MVVALVLAAASLAFVLLQRHQLESSLRDVARQQASDVAAQVSREGTQVDLVGGGGDQALVQVIDATGTVVAASASVSGEPPVVDLAPAPGEVITVSGARLPIGEGEGFVVVAEGVDSADGPMVVLAAQSLETVQESTSIVGRLLLLGSPLVLLAVALTMYWLTGRALAPVEAIRRRVATIDGTSTLSARVPVPPGGDEIARLAETMNSMLSRLQSAGDAQRRFVGDASHELRSPLSTIRAAHEIQALHPESADWTTMSDEVLSELDRVDRLVADLLLLARSDEHGLTLHLTDVDLDDLVHAEATRLRRRDGLHVVVTAPPVRVQGDEHHLARALRNLTDNALRHAVSRVELTLSTHGNLARIGVTDDGPGIPEGERERVFERFVRLDHSRARDSGGTGLGLPIARQIAHAHGGELRCDQARSGGSYFVLTIPLTHHGERQDLA
ncbi:two-component sensor histidine kinase [Nocardioides psychrotolerans]|uniref:histidine kinase n=1 Tax=Nocardioides psychrotolerans TaxID=1005945 RepID=A0A1I3PCJ8_9ACTN|nr:HAMP domain-containing sensor histidine kinase [Nocardioides psychrotolerans]GEP39648.1 two-component sensor histidine kinase [Nocardioides psychrotolerans]SFJ19245.1 Signal transduction histidine kinase [Nocardioides psychrotolerans]